MSGGDRGPGRGAALGALPPDEAAKLEEELAKNAVLATEVEEYRTVVETLESGIVREAPPAGLFDVVAQPDRRRARRSCPPCRWPVGAGTRADRGTGPPASVRPGRRGSCPPSRPGSPWQP